LRPQALLFTMSSSVGGWLALGFNAAAPGMAGADIVYAFVAPKAAGATSCVGLDGCAVTLVDAFASGHAQPAADSALGGASDVWALNASWSAAAGVSVSFGRGLSASATASASATDADLAQPVFVLWAYGAAAGDPASLAIAQHAAAGATAAQVALQQTAGACALSGGAVGTTSTAGAKKGGYYAVHGALSESRVREGAGARERDMRESARAREREGERD